MAINEVDLGFRHSEDMLAVHVEVLFHGFEDAALHAVIDCLPRPFYNSINFGWIGRHLPYLAPIGCVSIPEDSHEGLCLGTTDGAGDVLDPLCRAFICPPFGIDDLGLEFAVEVLGFSDVALPQSLKLCGMDRVINVAPDRLNEELLEFLTGLLDVLDVFVPLVFYIFWILPVLPSGSRFFIPRCLYLLLLAFGEVELLSLFPC